MRFPDPTRPVVLAGALLLAAGTLSACGASSDDDAAASSSSGSSSSASDVAKVSNGASQVAVTMTSDDGGTCSLDATKAKAGPVTFSVTNKSASSLTELELQSDNRIIGEKENLAPGLPTVKFTVTLGGGTYQIYCPGAAKEMQEFTVTGKTAEATGSTATLLETGTKGYAQYVDSVVKDMQTAVGTLNTAVQAGNLAQAKKDYALARPFYERIESDVDGFVEPGFKATDNAGNLDYLIDMRASNLDPKVGWHGLHAIERDLFARGAITAKTKQYSTELVTNVAKLTDVVGSLDYKPEDLANGAAGLLEEVQTNKISGEEEKYSHIDLVDFAGNVEGAEQAFAYLEPGLEKIDPTLTANVKTQFANVEKLLDTYRDPSIPGGFKYYDAALKAQSSASLSRAVQALQEPLSQIAEKVATAQ
ncbi:EfeM/EfeO family lipoprotein [Nocardioides mangrovicus]|uniref:EfeM/EfeO family lipoprotein n=1 Tax=Nocardioides mangrovicus TaxID=2478913 RepID=A0A3L8NXA9_9ACTN|nr:iron uptake system protein EfeO [Nocardioides mangrovicus]RLV47481.1 EfeM/EfeO family lipoprotein [Nocardioides mangrovicus]